MRWDDVEPDEEDVVKPEVIAFDEKLRRFGARCLAYGTATIIFAIIAFFSTLIVMCSASDDSSDYCYVQYSPLQRTVPPPEEGYKDLVLKQHIKWTADREVGRYDTVYDAVDAANAIQCDLK